MTHQDHRIPDHIDGATSDADARTGVVGAASQTLGEMHPDAPMLSSRETTWACVAVLLATLVALVAGA